MEPIINVSAALENLGDDRELLIELCHMMLPDLDVFREKLQTAVSTGNLVAAYQEAHALKGAVSNFVAEPLRLASFELEMAGKVNDQAKSESALVKVLEETTHFEQALKELISQPV
jgi:HPt (histidine-containing phosphotransfer) domain-containing protein